MIFSPDAQKQTQEIFFSRKIICFNNVPMIREHIQKPLGFFLYFELNVKKLPKLKLKKLKLKNLN